MQDVDNKAVHNSNRVFGVYPNKGWHQTSNKQSAGDTVGRRTYDNGYVGLDRQ